MTQRARWICAQLGSREHYAIPRVLHSEGRLDRLLTDFWATPRWLWKHAPGRRLAAVRERWHPELAAAGVHGLGTARLFFDAANRKSGWETILLRNEWFQERHLEWLRKNRKVLAGGAPGIFFAYSYAARELLRFFKEIGWKTVLGQIDPGPREEAIVAAEAERFPESKGAWSRAPERYWKLWREELEHSDLIVVNSEWSRECLQAEGVSEERMMVVPLAYEAAPSRAPARSQVERYSKGRPLRVLYLGQVNLRKGAHHLLEAAKRLAGAPIEFNFVGPVEISPPEAPLPNVKWHGAVSRELTARFYSTADVFALPTLSDGFALTQLEAMSHGLPVLATMNCGRVVEDGVNGWTLPAPSVDEIVKVLDRLAGSPGEVAAFAANAHVPEAFTLESLRAATVRIEEMFN